MLRSVSFFTNKMLSKNVLKSNERRMHMCMHTHARKEGRMNELTVFTVKSRFSLLPARPCVTRPSRLWLLFPRSPLLTSMPCLRSFWIHQACSHFRAFTIADPPPEILSLKLCPDIKGPGLLLFFQHSAQMREAQPLFIWGGEYGALRIIPTAVQHQHLQ